MNKPTRAFVQLPEGSLLLQGDILSQLRRRKFLTYSIVAWVVMVLCTIVFIVPSSTALRTSYRLLSEEKEKISIQQQQIETLEQLSLDDVRREHDVLSGVLPEEKPVLPLLYSLDRLAIGASVSVSNFSLSPGILGSGSGKIDESAQKTTISPLLLALPLKMQVEGSFDNLRTFFSSLDSVVPFIQVDTIAFRTSAASTTPAASAGAQYSAEVELSSLFVAKAPSGQGEVTARTSEQMQLLEKLKIAYAQRESDAKSEFVGISSPSGRTNLFAP